MCFEQKLEWAKTMVVSVRQIDNKIPGELEAHCETERWVSDIIEY